MSSSSSRSSSSTPSDVLREQLEATKAINQENHQSSDVIQNLQSKVRESVKLKEDSLALEAQLKIAKETINLQEAAFAFEKSEAEKEIQQLRQSEAQLRMKLTELETNIRNSTYTYEVQVKLSQNEEQIRNLTDKVEKLKTKTKDLENENKELQEKVDSVTEEKHQAEIEATKHRESFNSQQNLFNQQMTSKDQENQRLTEQLNKAEKKVKDLHNQTLDLQDTIAKLQQTMTEKRKKQKSLLEQSINACNDLQNQVDSVTAEKNKVSDMLKKAETKIIKQQAQMEDMQSRLEQTQETQDLISQINTSKADIDTLKGRINSLKGALLQSKTILEHVSVERDTIADLLGVETEELDKDWTSIKNKISELMESDRIINGLQVQNNKLRTRLTAALDDIKERKKEEERTAALEVELQKNQTLESTVQKLKEYIECNKALLQRYKMRLQFGHTIGTQAHKLEREISDLHFSIFGNNITQFRSIILSIIFAKRFFNSTINDSITDPQGLHYFYARPQVSVAKKIQEIREKFTDLSRDILLTKQSQVEYAEKYAESVKGLNAMKEHHQEMAAQNEEMRKKVAASDARNKELQEELATLIPKEDFQEALTREHALTKENEELQKLIADLKGNYDDKVASEQIANDKTQKLFVELKDKEILIDEYTNTIEEKDKCIKELNALIREKTKEILSLERIVQRYRQNENTIQSSYTCLAVENQTLIQKSGPNISTPPKPPQPDLNFSAAINPAFLGQ